VARRGYGNRDSLGLRRGRERQKRGDMMDHKGMDRREFLKKMALCSACALTGVVGYEDPIRAVRADQVPDIVVARGGAGPATRAAVNALGGMGRFVRPGQRVVIKPNMSFPNPPEWGTTTHPSVVRELAVMCHESGASEVLILDNPLRNADLSLERSGLKGTFQDFPGTRVEGITNRRFFERLQIPDGKDLKETLVMREVLEADVLISVPVAKSHSATGVSLSMKGMMGLIYERTSFHLILDLNRAIVDLCMVLKPALTVVDASRILTSGGPGGPGNVKALNRIIASTDMVAADAVTVELGTWYGRKFKADQVKHIKMAHEQGLGSLDTASQSVKEVIA
jgi:uncharacterized protein (DUF362 family)